MLFVGDDWADHHDVYLMNETGDKLASRRLPEGLAGISRLHELIAECAQVPSEVVVGIETDRGLWVDALTAAGYQMFAINPLAAARYRDRHHVSGAKSERYCQDLWMRLFQATSVSVDSPGSAGVMSMGRSSSLPLWNTAPARTRATRCGAFTARQRACAASISL